MKTIGVLLSLITLSNVYGYAQTERPIDQLLGKYLGIYQSAEACFVSMPRFTDVVGPRLEINFIASAEYRTSIDGNQENEYYVQFDYREDYSGQDPEINHHSGSAKVISATASGDITLLNLEAQAYSEFFDQDEEMHPVENISEKFQMKIQQFSNGSIKISTINAPSKCNLCWKFSEVSVYPLLWSKQRYNSN
jgi:hypothetical protein